MKEKQHQPKNESHNDQQRLSEYKNEHCDKVLKSELSQFCGRQPLKKLNEYGLLRQTISLQIF